MYKLIETSESLELSLPLIGANILAILIKNKKPLTVYDLLDKVYKANPNYGDNRVNQTLIFLYSLSAINLNGTYIEINNDNS